MTNLSVTPSPLVQLKEGLKLAVDSYRSFQQSEIPNDPKGFASYHQACKAALTHIMLLLKLIPKESSERDSSSLDWVGLARQALNGETEEDDDDMFPD